MSEDKVSEPIGAYEAKTRLPEYIRRVQEGSRFVITVRGRPVAELTPWQGPDGEQARDAVREMRDFMRRQRPAGVDIRALIEEGRD